MHIHIYVCVITIRENGNKFEGEWRRANGRVWREKGRERWCNEIIISKIKKVIKENER